MLYGFVLKRAKPYLYTKTYKGLRLVTTTYILRSNLNPFRRSGFFIYFYTIIGSAYDTDVMSLIKDIPLPLLFAQGFIIQ